MDIKLTTEEQAKYDDVYQKIISTYTKDDLKSLEEDETAKYFLKNIIIRYIFTGDFPDITKMNKIEINNDNEYHYDAKIPLQDKPNDLEVEIISAEDKTISNIVKLDYDELLSSLKIERTESN